MKWLLEKLGRDPRRSLTLFLRGLGLFALGAVFIYLGYYNHALWQVPGMILLGLGILLAALGYIGMFANRLLIIFSGLLYKLPPK
jgi:hypothetical protein